MKPIFSRQIDIDKIAFLNWRISEGTDILNLVNIADGFLMSSIDLAEQCISDNSHKRADILIFPILNNANHGIELYLKAMIWLLNKLQGSDSKIEGKHNIKQIYSTVKSKVRSYGGQLTINDFKEATKGLNNYINELFEKIEATPRNDKMDFSRYPFSGDYENHFYVDRVGAVEIDIENFVHRFKEIKSSLEKLVDFLYYYELEQNE